jgi:hypothetical protein
MFQKIRISCWYQWPRPKSSELCQLPSSNPPAKCIKYFQ